MSSLKSQSDICCLAFLFSIRQYSSQSSMLWMIISKFTFIPDKLPSSGPGWSKFFTLVGHFSKLFKLVDLSWLEIVPNHSVLSKKKRKFSLGIGLGCLKISRQYGNPRFCPVSSLSLFIEGCRCSYQQDFNCIKLFSGPQKITLQARAAVWITMIRTKDEFQCLQNIY